MKGKSKMKENILQALIAAVVGEKTNQNEMGG
jgi:hypothetical protein